MPERILVTGGAGFLGSHLVERFVADGQTVHLVDDLSTGRLDNLAAVRNSERLHIVVDSILNWHMMKEVVAQVDRVVHLSAAVGSRRFLDTPVDAITTWVRGTEILLSLADQRGLPVFLASTSEVYGRGGGRVAEDDDRVMGSVADRRSHPAAAKVLGEVLGIAYHVDRGLPVTIGRFFDLAGPRQTEEVGPALATWVAQALRGEDLIIDPRNVGVTSCCHVLDAVEAIVGLVGSPEATGRVFNIGSEVEYEAIALAGRVREMLNSESAVVRGPVAEVKRSGPGMERPLPDTSRIRNAIGWTPSRDLDATIRDIAGFLTGSLGG